VRVEASFQGNFSLEGTPVSEHSRVADGQQLNRSGTTPDVLAVSKVRRASKGLYACPLDGRVGSHLGRVSDRLEDQSIRLPCESRDESELSQATRVEKHVIVSETSSDLNGAVRKSVDLQGRLEQSKAKVSVWE
jgi:hypothetical protein